MEAHTLWGYARGYFSENHLLTDLACKNAVAGAMPYKLTDGEGLYLHVSKTGTKVWRWKFRVGGKEKLLTIGRYPGMKPAAARLARNKARLLLDTGVDPSTERKQRKLAQAAELLDTFEKAARAWHQMKARTLSTRYADAVLSRLNRNVFKHIGNKRLTEITAPMVLDVIRKIEKREAHDMAHRVRNHISDVFVWAIASGLADYDPASIIRKALIPTDPRLRPAIVNLADVRKVLTTTELQRGAHWSTLLASRLLALTAARLGVVRLAERKEFEGLDGKNPIWRIPAEKMKLTRQRKRDITWEFVIPLSRQAVAVVKAAQNSSQSKRWLFHGIGNWERPISDSTLSKLYREAGFTDIHVPHGWRSTFSTLMNEQAAIADRESDRSIIDLMLAHAQNGVEPIYNRASYMPRRREIAQTWADMLTESMACPSSLLPDQRKWRGRESGHDDGEPIRKHPRKPD